MKRIFPSFLLLVFVLAACSQPAVTHPAIDRLSTIPADNLKGTPENDLNPPVASSGWSQPVPLEGPVNTAGAEDSPFIPIDGQSLYFFFTPDANIPATDQVRDGVTGIWVSSWTGSGWGEPERVWLMHGNDISLDGCEFVLGEIMWFCSVRAGNLNEIDWYIARWTDGAWSDWKNAGDPINGEYQVGEMHITADGQQLYFASQRPGGVGGFDLWVSQNSGGEWETPVNLGAGVNTTVDENRPFLTSDGQELWYDSNYAIYRCLRQGDGTWGDCDQIISPLAGEPTLSPDGNTLYFVHHFLTADQKIIEADIYVSHRNP